MEKTKTLLQVAMISKKGLLMALLLLISHLSFSQVSLGTTTPNESAALDLTSSTQGFLPPRMTRLQMEAIIAPQEGLLVYCSDCIPKGVYTFSGNTYTNIGTGAGSGAVIQSVVSESGRTWMDRNLGAIRVAQTADDYQSFGYLYQWGRRSDGHEIVRWSSASEGAFENGTTNVTATGPTVNHGDFITIGPDSNWTDFTEVDGVNENNLWQDYVKGTNDPCPTGYRVPTVNEFAYEISVMTTDAASSALKISNARYRGDTGNLQNVNDTGRYWTSSVSAINSSYVQFNNFGDVISNISGQRVNAYSIRCIADELPADVVVSSTGQIWMDRNLGANRVAQSSTDFEGYGDLYQWGRRSDGHQTVAWAAGSQTLSGTTTVQAFDQAPFFDDFVINADTWTTYADSDFLWKSGDDDTNDPCPENFRVPTLQEFQKEVDAFPSSNAAGAYNSVLKLPLTGRRAGSTGSLESRNSVGFYWVADPAASLVNRSSFVFILPGSIFTENATVRSDGMPVRCIYDPDNTLVSLAGRVWMDRNLGASREATSLTDFEAYGSMYQWGRNTDGHEVINWTSSTTTDGAEQSRETDVLATTATPNHADFITSANSGTNNWTSFSGNNLWADEENDPCPSGYHVPSSAEFQAEVAVFSSSDINEAFKHLKLPSVGYRQGGSGTIVASETAAYYWTSTIDGNNSIYFSATQNSAATSDFEGTSFDRARALAVRCIRDE